MSATTTTTTMTTTMRSYTPTTAKPGSISASASMSSGATSNSLATPTTPTPTTPTTAKPARVRFDAECVLIPDLGGGAGSKRPRMVTKSYSLPLWKKSSKEEDVVLKVALPRWAIHRWLLF
ncbi:hypothetical protein B0H14DRAFT_2875207, partial [Mycena olivaceomarginata]